MSLRNNSQNSKSIPKRPNTVAFLGDSITDMQTYVASGGMADRNSGGGVANFMPRSISMWALMYSKGTFTYGGVFATPGYTAAQILATHVPQVISAAPDACVVLAGTNKGSSLAQDISDLTAIWSALINANIKPILCTLPPYGASPVSDGSPTTIRNAFIRRYARLNALPLVDYYDILTDPNTGSYIAAYNYDDIHPSNYGARAMGMAIASAVISQLSGVPVANLAVTNVGNTDLLMAHPLMLSMNGSAPQDWASLAGLGTSTITNPAGPSGIVGNVMTLTRGDTDMNVAGTPVTLVPGHRYEFAFVMRNTVTPGTGSIQFRLENASTGGQYLWYFGIDISNSDWNTMYFEMLVPNTLTNGYSYRPRIEMSGANSVFELAQFTWQDLTANGIA